MGKSGDSGRVSGYRDDGLIRAVPAEPPGEGRKGVSAEGRRSRAGFVTPLTTFTGCGRISSRIAVGGWIVMPLVGGSSSGTRAGRSSLIGGVPRFRRLFGVRGISKDIVCSVIRTQRQGSTMVGYAMRLSIQRPTTYRVIIPVPRDPRLVRVAMTSVSSARTM